MAELEVARSKRPAVSEATKTMQANLDKQSPEHVGGVPKIPRPKGGAPPSSEPSQQKVPAVDAEVTDLAVGAESFSAGRNQATTTDLDTTRASNSTGGREGRSGKAAVTGVKLVSHRQQSSPTRPTGKKASGSPRKKSSSAAKGSQSPEEKRAQAELQRFKDELQPADVDAAIDAAKTEGAFVQGGETYHNERAMKALESKSAKRQASQKAKLEAERSPEAQRVLDQIQERSLLSTQRQKRSRKEKVLGVTGEEIEGQVTSIKEDLKDKGLSGGKSDRVYGSLLHTELRSIAETRIGRSLDPNTEFFNDRTLAEIKRLPVEESQMKVADWLQSKGLEDPGLSQKVLNQKIGSMKPDLAFREPGGTVQVIDLTGQPTSDHLAKTILYSMVLGMP